MKLIITKRFCSQPRFESYGFWNLEVAYWAMSSWWAASCQWDCCRTEQSWLSKGVLCAQLFIFKTYYKIRQCVITIHDSAAYYNLRECVITMHDSLVMTILRNCYNKRQIFQFTTLLQFTTEHNDFPHRKSYWENILFNRLACKRYFNTSLRLLYNSFWLRTWLWKLCLGKIWSKNVQIRRTTGTKIANATFALDLQRHVN